MLSSGYIRYCAGNGCCGYGVLLFLVNYVAAGEGHAEAVEVIEARRAAEDMQGCKDGKDAVIYQKKQDAVTTAAITRRSRHLWKVHQEGIKGVQVLVNVKEIHVKVLERISLIFNIIWIMKWSNIIIPIILLHLKI